MMYSSWACCPGPPWAPVPYLWWNTVAAAVVQVHAHTANVCSTLWWCSCGTGIAGTQNARVTESWQFLLRFQRKVWEAKQRPATEVERSCGKGATAGMPERWHHQLCAKPARKTADISLHPKRATNWAVTSKAVWARPLQYSQSVKLGSLRFSICPAGFCSCRRPVTPFFRHMSRNVYFVPVWPLYLEST